MMSLANDDRWRETADAATRAQYPEEYWCVADDGWAQYFWAEGHARRVPRKLRQVRLRMNWGGVGGVVGIEGGVVSGLIHLESSGVGASDWRPRHEEHYQEV